MIFRNKHGHTAAPDTGLASDGQNDDMPVSRACGFPTNKSDGNPEFAPFDYFFPDAPATPHAPGMAAALDALADAMVEQSPSDADDSEIPPVFTCLGQFIDHNVTADTDRETGISAIDTPEVEPVPRARVANGLGNLSAGSLNLDSLYGGGPVQGPFSVELADALRSPGNRAKLWAGTLSDAGLGSVPPPADPAGDLLRLGRAIGEPNPALSESEIRALPDPLRAMFVNEDGTLRAQRPGIGEPRNDENLIVAQLHLAFVRFHNSVVDEAHRHISNPQDREAVFIWARRMVTWHYQWIVIREFLPTICDPGIAADVLAQGAPLYSAFFSRVRSPRPHLMPMPLEFSVSAFRFEHSMVRTVHDWSRSFGRAEAGTTPLIDTLLAPLLSDMANASDPGTLRRLARRNLRRGHRLSIPSAQACVAGINGMNGSDMPVLSAEEISAPLTATALEDGGFLEATPLWFYVLREAEVLGRNGRLGPLGSRLIAETLAGLAIKDPTSYWHQPGSDPDGRWSPDDGVAPNGVVVDGVASMLRASGVL